MTEFQSGFKALHNTETAPVLNGIFLMADSGKPMALVLLDLSAAVDITDHNIFLSHLESYVGLCGTGLQWFHSYLSSMCFTV